MPSTHSTPTPTANPSARTAPAEGKPPNGRYTRLSRKATSAVEHRLIAALRAVDYKTSNGGTPPCKCSKEQEAYAAGVEVERLLKAVSTPAKIILQSGEVTPVDGLEESLNEAPLIDSGDIEMPAWATEATDHHWIEVELVGTEQKFLVDLNSPPQFTGKPTPEPTVIDIGTTSGRPPQYQPETQTNTYLSSTAPASIETPWDITTPTYPFGTPETTSSFPADGGQSVTPETNSVLEVSAREGLAKLPANSVDVIVTSPPYRLQVAYPNATTIFGGSSSCDHEWDETILNTDTPVDTLSGSGLSDDRTVAEQQDARNRVSRRCKHCDAWKGQLGHEPQIGLFVDHLVGIFEEAMRVLSDDGSLFVNIGDSYDALQSKVVEDGRNIGFRDAPKKSLVALPARLQLQMIEEGYVCREHVCWQKPNAPPEGSVTDRADKAWEHVFRFTKSGDYADTGNGPDKNVLTIETSTKQSSNTAPMPKELPRTLIKSALEDGSGGTVLDMFAGAGTVLEAAADLGHNYLGFEINPDTAQAARDRLPDRERESQTLTGQQGLAAFSNAN